MFILHKHVQFLFLLLFLTGAEQNCGKALKANLNTVTLTASADASKHTHTQQQDSQLPPLFLPH